MRRNTQGRLGVTLMELMIAVMLVSLLSVGILYSLRFGLDTLNHTTERLMANRRVLGAQRILDQQLAGTLPVALSCGGQNGPATVFFQGQPSGMRMVSRYTLEEAARGYPRIVEYTVIAGERGVGVRLVVNEFLYTGPASLIPFCGGMGVAMQTGSRPFVVADKLAGCRFSYLLEDPRTKRRAWSEAFAGKTAPAAIRIEMLPLEPHPAQLQMTTMTFPIHVNPDAAERYADIEEP